MFKPKILLLFFLINTSGSAMADKKVIDLGELSVEGDVRKPLIISLQSQEENKRIRKNLIEKEFNKIEKELLSIKSNGDHNE